jgi:26S proteasome regulatory subunit N3
MEVDTATPAPASTATNADATPSAKKPFAPPLDSATQDLLPECTVYLRLLLVLAAIDAGKIEEVRNLMLEAIW